MLPPIVRLVTIPRLEAVLSHADGAHPETAAHTPLLAWARPHGLLDDPGVVMLLGRNNPCPTPGRPDYGYDSMLAAAGPLPAAPGLEPATIPPGTWAVVRCSLANITERWGFLYAWVRASGREPCGHGLEELLTEVDESRPHATVLDLWLPLSHG